MAKPTAAMAQAMVTKAAKKDKMTCATIFGKFDPPIKMGAYKEMRGSKKGYQAEHVPPCSLLHESGRHGPPFSEDCSGYDTEEAWTWMVSDGQSEDEEHKLLTDPMREFSKENFEEGVNATRDEWMDEYEKATVKALKNSNDPRKITDPSLDPDSLIKKAAKCIRLVIEAYFDSVGITEEVEFRNSWPSKAQQAIQAAKAAAGKAAAK
jgi:hypothetical protein